MRNFRQLKVWEKGHWLTLAIYETTAKFPREELYGLTSHIRRSCASIPANIAEGCGRTGDAELVRFLRIALGSASELEYHLLLARDLRYLSSADFAEAANGTEQVKRMLRRLVDRLTTRDSRLMTHD